MSEVSLGSVSDDDSYVTFLGQIQDRFSSFTGKQLFTTDVVGLFDAFISNLPSDRRQHYTCSSCRKFVDTFGGLVTIDETGIFTSAMWSLHNVPDLFRGSVVGMKQLIRKGSITGVFLHGSTVLGNPVTGEWHHMSVMGSPVYSHSLKTPFQGMAEKKEEYVILSRSLDEFNQTAVEQAVSLLKTESLYRSEECLGVAEWLLELHRAISGNKNRKVRDNLIWLAVATAPTGYCHVRSSMIGTLLEDIAAGMDFGAVSRRFAEKMHPLQYQRPQSLPSEGGIKKAEEIVRKLGLERSLLRRFARLDEVKSTWAQRPVGPIDDGNGVFSHLKTKDKESPSPGISLPAITITWEKFRRTVLEIADGIELYIPHGRNTYSALVTAVDPQSPPILQWDNPSCRNPVSWYQYHAGSSPDQWGLIAGQYRTVSAVCLSPAHWNGPMPNQVDCVFFILDGAKDSRNQSICLFPEILKSELREVRSVIEAYSRSERLEGQEDASACGLCLQRGSEWKALVRVTTGKTVAEYKLDRWD